MSVFTNPASASREQAAAYTRAILGLLGEDDPRQVLGATTERLRDALVATPEELRAVREAPGKWSVGHVVRHLADSEIVWGYRLRMVLAQDRPPLTGYDQDAWAERLRYAEASADESFEEFAVLRRGHLRLLERVSPEELDRVGVHAERGPESVGHMLRLYAGHDRLHLRQIERIRAALEGRGA